MNKQEHDLIAAEIKISVTPKSWEELQELILKIRENCTSEYKLEVKAEGNFFKS